MMSTSAGNSLPVVFVVEDDPLLRMLAVDVVEEAGFAVTIAAQSMQTAGLISYRRGAIQVSDRQGLEKASCQCYAIVKERFDAFLTPPPTAVPGHDKSRSDQGE